MAKNIKFLPVVLFFYTSDITQAQAAAAQEYWDNVDVHYRLNYNGNKGDILESFDGLAGKPPSNYVAAATAASKPFVECTMAEITAGTAGKFDGLTTNTQGRSAGLRTFSAATDSEGVQDVQNVPTEQAGAAAGAAAGASTGAIGTPIAPPAGGTIAAPVEGQPVVTTGNPSTTSKT